MTRRRREMGMRTGNEGDTRDDTKSIRIIRVCGTAATAPSASGQQAFVERIVAFDHAHVPEQLAAAGHVDEHGGPPAQ